MARGEGRGASRSTRPRSIPFSLRRPRLILGAATLAVIVLGLIGTGVEGRLTPSSLAVPGTPSAEGSALLKAHFGDSAPFAILLRGPAPAIERQGPRLVRALRRDPAVTTLSPWDGRALSRLRPTPRKALILATWHVDQATAVRDVVPRLERTLARLVHAPVRATQTGFASLSRAIQDESIASTERAELIALPFLALVLLLVLRSPIAALIPLGFGAVTVLVARGLLWLAAGSVSIDAFSLTVATMMGLALGVDYSLLMVARFREELAAGAEPRAAALATRRTAGRTTLFAGSTLVCSMLVSVFVLPGSLLLSLAGTAILTTAVSVLVANHLVPALLVALGGGLDRLRIGPRRPAGASPLLERSLAAALRRPAPIAIAIGAALLVLAAPALSVRTGPPSVAQLPAGDPARSASELVSREMGPGWNAPFVIVAATDRGPITTTGDLRELASLQGRLASQPGVREVIGPGRVAKRADALRSEAADLMGPPGAKQVRSLLGLAPKLAEAGGGVGRIRAGLGEAASGAELLREGSNRARAGAGQLASGLRRAAGGGDRARGAIDRLAGGAGRLAEGQRTAKAGALSLALGLHDLLPELRKGSLGRARRIRGRLRTLAKEDPALGRVRAEVELLVANLAAQRDEVRRLRNTATRLHGGASRLAAGQARLAAGSRRLAGEADKLGSGLHRLAAGASALAGGLERLTDGTGALASNLASGAARAAPLQGGLARAGVTVGAQAAEVARRRRRLLAASPHLFDSGDFVLSALDGSPPRRRSLLAQSIDLDGGQGAAILVVPRAGLGTPASEALYRRLRRLAANFGRRSGLEAGVAGGPAQIADYNDVTHTRVPLVIAAMTLVTFLALVVILRALLLAALAVVLNLATVGVAFGVLALLFHVPAGRPLGGHDYVDAIGAAAIFGITFGLSVDYAVFLLARMRERHEEGACNRAAVTFGLEKTARVITGAAAIMMAVFVSFAAADIATVSQLGVGLAVAVALDATVVRILLLPALMLLAGERVWWLPGPLERLLPRVRVEAEPAGAGVNTT